MHTWYVYAFETHTLVQIHDWQNGDRDQWISFEQFDLDRKLIASVQHIPYSSWLLLKEGFLCRHSQEKTQSYKAL